MGIRVSGIQAVIDDINIMLSAAEANSLLEAGAQPLLQQMQQNASSNPKVISGKLRGSLGIEAHGGKSVTIGVHRKDWGGDEYYPAYVEYGHGGPHPAPAHPYIRPAVDAKAGETMDLITVLLRQALGN